jgi:hypothetical protein
MFKNPSFLLMAIALSNPIGKLPQINYTPVKSSRNLSRNFKTPNQRQRRKLERNNPLLRK